MGLPCKHDINIDTKILVLTYYLLVLYIVQKFPSQISRVIVSTQYTKESSVIRGFKCEVVYSFVYNVKSTGVLTQPWVATALIDLVLERVLLTFTCWIRSVRKERNHLIVKGLTL